MFNEKSEALVMLRLRDVLKRTGLSRSTIYNKLNVASCHYDAKFPKQIRVGKTSVRWIESEINSWVEECVKLSRQSHGSMAAII
ncbi:helix-turn-helix transcriptional regulator, partial [Pseudomonas helleri]